MRRSIQVIGKYFKDFSMTDTQLPLHEQQRFEPLANEVLRLLAETDDKEQVLYDLVAITFANGMKAGRRQGQTKAAEKPVLQGTIVHGSRDY